MQLWCRLGIHSISLIYMYVIRTNYIVDLTVYSFLEESMVSGATVSRLALGLTGPLDSWDETYIPAPPPACKRSSLQWIGASGLEEWQFGLGPPPPRCSSSGRIRKRAKARSHIRDRKLQIWNWEYDWHSWTVKMRIPQEKEERQYLYCYMKVSKIKPIYQQMTLFPKLGVVEISTQRHFRAPLLIQMFIIQMYLLPPDFQGLECHPRFSNLICWRCRSSRKEIVCLASCGET